MGFAALPLFVGVAPFVASVVAPFVASVVASFFPGVAFVPGVASLTGVASFRLAPERVPLPADICDRRRFPLECGFVAGDTPSLSFSAGGEVSRIAVQLLSRSFDTKVFELPRYVTSVTQSFLVILSPFLGSGLISFFKNHPSRSRSAEVVFKK